MKRGELVLSSDDISKSCEALDLYTGKKKFAKPPVYRRHMGSRKYDFLGTSFPPFVLISIRFKETLETIGATGWRAQPIEIDDPNVDSSEYFLLIVSGKCGPLQNERSRPKFRPPLFGEGKPLKVYMGLYFDYATWDGSDFFLPEGTGHKFVTEKVVAGIKKAKLTGVCIQPIEDVERIWLKES